MNKVWSFVKAVVVGIVINIPLGVFLDIYTLWKTDISGATLNGFSGFPAWAKMHPKEAKILDIVDAIWRILEYWVGTGLIGIVGPILGVYALWHNWNTLWKKDPAFLLVGATIFVGLTALIEIKWVIPYFYSKATNPKRLNP